MNFLENNFLLTSIYCISILLIINFFFKKKKILLHLTFNQIHKRENKGTTVVLSGGIFLILIFFFINIFNDFYLLNFTFYSLFYLIIGIFSDLNNKISAKLRLLIILIISFLILIHSQIIIDKINITIIDFFLQFNVISLLIFTIALVTIINGSNFIDGNNANCSGYFLLIYGIIFFNSEKFNLNQNDIFLIFNIIISLIVFSILNLFNKNYLGDNGSYLIGFFTGLYCMHLFSKYSIPSLFIVAILSYPFAEVCFSIIRKLIEKSNPLYPDNLHLHQLIEKNLFKISNNVIKNNISTLIIFLLNLIFFISLYFSDLSKVNLIKSISAYLFFYICFYLSVRTIKKSKK